MLSATRNASIAVVLMLPGAAFASSDQAWSQFAKDVEQKCTDASAEIFRRPQVVVDPTGTETYGVAIVFGRSKEAKGRAAVVCVVDKKTGKVELGSELGPDVIRVRRGKPQGEDSNKPRNKRVQQDQGDQQKQNMDGDTGGQDDADDDQQ